MRKDFCLCFNDAYVPYASVTIKSIMDHVHADDDIHIHIISDYISPHNETFLKSFGDGIHIYIYAGNSPLLENIKTSKWDIRAWYRILLPEMLDDSIDRVLYLDCDIIVNNHLDELFAMDLNNKSIAACIDMQSFGGEIYQRLGYQPSKQYVCSGVLLMNIKKWKEMNISLQVTDFARTYPNKIEFPDQDSINYVCQDDKIILPHKYGILVPFFRDRRFIKEYISEINTLIDSPAIIHYAGYHPWVYCKDKSIHSNLWWETYKSLNKFPQVKIDYVKSIFKYFLRFVLSKLHLINRHSKYHIDQYYNHPKVTKQSVLKLIKEIG